MTKTITVTITIPDGVEFTPVVTTTPASGAPALSGSTPVCPKHGPEKVKPSTKFTGYFCTATDESTDRGYCKWQQR